MILLAWLVGLPGLSMGDRQRLRGVLAGVAVRAAGMSTTRVMPADDDFGNPDVVVCGAGVAGIASA
jgi:hypothetical protein